MLGKAMRRPRIRDRSRIATQSASLEIQRTILSEKSLSMTKFYSLERNPEKVR